MFTPERKKTNREEMQQGAVTVSVSLSLHLCPRFHACVSLCVCFFLIPLSGVSHLPLQMRPVKLSSISKDESGSTFRVWRVVSALMGRLQVASLACLYTHAMAQTRRGFVSDKNVTQKCCSNSFKIPVGPWCCIWSRWTQENGSKL